MPSDTGSRPGGTGDDRHFQVPGVSYLQSAGAGCRGQRGTLQTGHFPAIVLSVAYLKDVLGVAEDEPIVICPVDPYVETAYFQALQALCDRAGESEANLVLMGIEPTYPSEKYGYIIPETADDLSRVTMFREKPTKEAAEEYIAKGAVCLLSG